MELNLRQFKLSNLEEIICEVVSWPEKDGEPLLIRKALKIYAIDDGFEDGQSTMRYYTFKPWVLINNDVDSVHFLNRNHIISESKPTTIAVNYFVDVVKEIRNINDEDEEIEYVQLEGDSTEEGTGNIIH